MEWIIRPPHPTPRTGYSYYGLFLPLRVNPPLGFVFNKCDPVHELKLIFFFVQRFEVLEWETFSPPTLPADVSLMVIILGLNLHTFHSGPTVSECILYIVMFCTLIPFMHSKQRHIIMRFYALVSIVRKKNVLKIRDL